MNKVHNVLDAIKIKRKEIDNDKELDAFIRTYQSFRGVNYNIDSVKFWLDTIKNLINNSSSLEIKFTENYKIELIIAIELLRYHAVQISYIPISSNVIEIKLNL